MKITKRQLRRIIREEKAALIEECPSAESNMPCPIRTAAEMRAAGASEADVLHWVQLLISEFSGGTEEAYPEEEEFSFTGDVSLLPGEEAFGVGYEAGSRGLE
tara:strand:- start:102 stop:410 length:309 start_codon:yes stop_codon:yes gene_type:complete